MFDYALRNFEVSATNLDAFAHDAGKRVETETLVTVLKAVEEVFSEYEFLKGNELIAYHCVNLALYALEDDEDSKEDMRDAARMVLREIQFNRLCE